MKKEKQRLNNEHCGERRMSEKSAMTERERERERERQTDREMETGQIATVDAVVSLPINVPPQWF